MSFLQLMTFSIDWFMYEWILSKKGAPVMYCHIDLQSVHRPCLECVCVRERERGREREWEGCKSGENFAEENKCLVKFATLDVWANYDRIALSQWSRLLLGCECAFCVSFHNHAMVKEWSTKRSGFMIQYCIRLSASYRLSILYHDFNCQAVCFTNTLSWFFFFCIPQLCLWGAPVWVRFLSMWPF